MSLLAKYDPSNTSAYNAAANESYLSSGCENLDKFLNGGFIKSGVTQIYGEAGVGKTQLALQLCLTAQAPIGSIENPRVKSVAAYICTEASFPANRLKQMITKSPIVNRYPVISDKNIFIDHVSSTEDLENCIFNPFRLPQLLKRHRVNVLVIDSIAATYRTEYESTLLRNRAKSLRKIGYGLHKIAKEHQVSVVCLNQVSAVIGNTFDRVSRKEQPSLGITWASMVTNSLYMFKRGNSRYVYVAGSSFLPRKFIEFEILESGVIAKFS
ncbi:hypothetical protein TKK_0001408 [Trichogramma kaykai]|uniref:RecA family profile 1 domain-containing protein n=1 Tax=Trichogramma kaykai TaxID=54128 RepID=A0ABD2X2L5_9HYME